MLIGTSMLLVPIIVYLATLRLSRRLKPVPGLLYRTLGGIVVFSGGAISLYLAAYTGDQGGIAAFFFQIAVIVTYALLSTVLVIASWFMEKRESANHEGWQ